MTLDEKKKDKSYWLFGSNVYIGVVSARARKKSSNKRGGTDSRGWE